MIVDLRTWPSARTVGRGLLLVAFALLVSVSASACVKPAPPSLEEVRRLYDAGDYAKAIEGGRAIVEVLPKDVEAHRILALAMSASQDVTGAIGEYTAVLDGAPEDHESLYRRGLLRRVARDLSGAEKDLRAAAELQPTAISYADALAETLVMADKTDEAASVWERLVSVSSTDAQRIEFARKSARAYGTAGDTAAADRMWRKLLELAPKDEEASTEAGSD